MQHIHTYAVVIFIIISIVFGKINAADGQTCFSKKLSLNGKCITSRSCNLTLTGRFDPDEDSCTFDNKHLICCIQDGDGDQPKIISTSVQKCREYEQIVTNLTKATCPFSKVITAISSSDTIFAANEFPYMVALVYESENGTRAYLCDGALISKNFVVTSAHCLHLREFGGPKYVRLGTIDLREKHGIEVNVSRTIKHPNYHPRWKSNDIGLVQLQDDVVFSQTIYPACLNTHEKTRSSVFTTIWGSTEFGNIAKDILIKEKIRVQPFKNCALYYVHDRRAEKQVESVLCGGGFEEEFLCRGAGSPLLQFSEEFCMYKIIGVMSRSGGCLSDKPSVFAKIDVYIPWIEENVWKTFP